MPEYELRDYLETIQNRALEDLTAALPSEGDSTQVVSDETNNAKSDITTQSTSCVMRIARSVTGPESSRSREEPLGDGSTNTPSKAGRADSRISSMQSGHLADRERSVTVDAE